MDLGAILADHVERGERLDLDGATVPATLVRAVILGRLAPDPDPRGLRLRNATIDGRLDLDRVVSTTHIELVDCEFPAGLSAQDARLGTVVLDESRFRHTTEYAVNLRRLTATSLQLRHAYAASSAEMGALSLASARVGSVDLSGATLRNDTGVALSANDLRGDGNLWLRDRFTAAGTSPLGTVLLSGAVIGGQLGLARRSCARASVRHSRRTTCGSAVTWRSVATPSSRERVTSAPCGWSALRWAATSTSPAR